MEKNMKVGVLTFFRPINNGAVLQACAMTKIVLKKMGIDSELIDYRLKRIETDRKLFGMDRIMSENRYIRKIRRIIADIVRFPVNYRQRKLFDKFINTYLAVSQEKYYNLDEMVERCQNYDAYIVGSDLVWNPLMAEGVNPVYFLSFVKGNKPRIAYAPSVGTVSLTESQMAAYRECLQFLDSISVRESSTAEQLSALTNYEIKTVLDPTLLTDCEDWDVFYDSEAIVKESYVFAFSLEQSDALIDIVNEIAKKKDCIIVAYGRKNRKYKAKKVLFTDGKCGPSELLNYVKNALCVITNSFHGCAFSIIFYKNFYCIPHSTRGVRMINLLNSLGLENRLISSKADIKEEVINYSEVEYRRKGLMDKSIHFLEKSLERERT